MLLLPLPLLLLLLMLLYGIFARCILKLHPAVAVAAVGSVCFKNHLLQVEVCQAGVRTKRRLQGSCSGHIHPAVNAMQGSKHTGTLVSNVGGSVNISVSTTG